MAFNEKPRWRRDQWNNEFHELELRLRSGKTSHKTREVGASVFCPRTVRILSVFRKDSLYETLKGSEFVSEKSRTVAELWASCCPDVTKCDNGCLCFVTSSVP